MHNHNKDGGGKGMMWGMIICCALLLGFLFLGGSSFPSGGYVWPILIGIFVLAHIWMMFNGHGGHGGHGGDSGRNHQSHEGDEQPKQ